MLNIFSAETDEDLEDARKLFIEYADGLEFDLCFQNFEEELGDLPGDYTPPEGCLLLARYKGQVAGCVGLRELNDGVCEMKRLYVKQELRGLKIGKALAEAITEQARRIGYNCMVLDYISPRETAKSLYESLGFKETLPYEDIPIEGAVFLELGL